MKLLLVPTDFSENSHKAVRYAAEIARESGAEIILMNAWHVTPTDSEFVEFNTLASYQLLADASQESLMKAKSQLEDEQMVKVNILSKEGLAADVIPLVMEDTGAGLTIMGTRGMGAVGRTLLGSVTSRVIDLAKGPVLAIPPEAPLAPKFEQIAFATDFHDNDAESLALLIEIASIYNAHITVVHFKSEIPRDETDQDFFNQYEKIHRERFSYPRLSFEFIRTDRLNDAMDRFVENRYIDLLALASMKRSTWQRFFDPSLTKHELGRLKIPLLVFTAVDEPSADF